MEIPQKVKKVISIREIKGIGFKNIYQLFDKVIVDSNGYRFLLDDTYEVDSEKLYEEYVRKYGIRKIYSDREGKVEDILKELKNLDDVKENGEKTKFPIIQILKNEPWSDIDKSFYFFYRNNMIGEGIIEDDLTAFKFRLRKEIGLKGLQKQLERSCILRLFLSNLENIYIDEQCYEYCPVQERERCSVDYGRHSSLFLE